MASTENHRLWYAHECDANAKMLAMIRGVPEGARADGRYGRALALAAHLAACRENFLASLSGSGERFGPWWPEPPDLDELERRFAKIQDRWTAYLDSLTDAALDASFEFEDNGYRFAGHVEDQIMQLAFHAFYHRGQVVQLVDQLGGETVDTDYIDWIIPQRPDRWHAV
ncbi:MAG TPA: DinB family protein [Fimbriimonadaceae bacterium]|nr:DinB family protein [Fimbriimonadaceae bacterium]